MLALIEEAEKGPLQHIAQQHRQHNADSHGGKKASPQRVAHNWRQGVSHVGAYHVETAMRQIDDAHDPEDQRQPGGDQEQQQPVLKCIEALDQEDGKFHDGSLILSSV